MNPPWHAKVSLPSGSGWVPRSDLLPERDRERALTYRLVEVVTRAFLARLTKTLDALGRFDLFPGEKTTTPLR